MNHSNTEPVMQFFVKFHSCFWGPAAVILWANSLERGWTGLVQSGSERL